VPAHVFVLYAGEELCDERRGDAASRRGALRRAARRRCWPASSPHARRHARKRCA